MAGSIFGADGKPMPSISNAYIESILRDEDPFAIKEVENSIM
jgi:hypothetical protein